MSTEYTFMPVKGYSVPAVRVSVNGAVATTLSFTAKGRPINPPIDCPQAVLKAAWKAWVAATL
jgi:hypothetical protein